MKMIKVLIVIFTIVSVGFSQNRLDSLVILERTIDTTKQHLLYDYRLPKWGYDRVNFNLSGNLSGANRSNSTTEHENSSDNVSFTPYYNSYLESEKAISSIQVSLASSFQNYHSKDKLENVNSKFDGFSVGLNFRLNANLLKYVHKSWYLYFNTANQIRFSESDQKSIDTFSEQKFKTEQTNIQRTILPSFRLGAGYGKVRNVTPLFRALRLNERLKSITGGEGINDSDLMELAGVLSRKASYGLVYDRPDKYFYADLPENLSKKLEGMKPWEIIYLSDAWSEITGDRYEGFDINGGLDVEYEKYTRTSSIENTELFLVGIYLKQRYFHNMTLNYQIGTEFNSSFSKAVNDNTQHDFIGHGDLQLLNLWNVTDKILLESTIGLTTDFVSLKEDNNINWKRWDNYFANISFRYFLENNLSLNASISYDKDYDWPEQGYIDDSGRRYRNSIYDEQNNWSIRFSLSYFLTRTFN